MRHPLHVVGTVSLEPSPEATPEAPTPSRFARLSKLVLTFAVGQGLVQGVNSLTGILLMHWMSRIAYAQYMTAFTFQSSLVMVVDLGFNYSVVPLVGDRRNDPRVIGKYVRTVKSLRLKTLVVAVLGSTIVFPFILRNQDWPWTVKATLWAAVVSAVAFSMNDVYRTPLLIHQELKKLYRTDIIPAVVRLTISYFLYIAGRLYGWIAAWFSALTFLQTAFMLRRAAKPYVDEPLHPDPEAQNEIIRYRKPLWPGMIYYAFQGGIVVALIAYFGGTNNIAETAALGRLGQLFTFLASSIPTVFVPVFARTSGRAFVTRFSMGLFSLASLLGFVTVLAFLWRAPFLFILGKKYHGVGDLIGSMMLASSLVVVAGFLYQTAAVKRWVSSLVGLLSIAVPLTVQVVYIGLHGVRTTREAVDFQVAVAATNTLFWGVFVAWNLAKGNTTAIGAKAEAQ